MLSKPLWFLVLLAGEMLFLPAFLNPTSGFMVLDHAMCKDVEFASTRLCKQRTVEFLLSDAYAWLWVNLIAETSDLGAKVQFRFYNPKGELFVAGPSLATGLEAVRIQRQGQIATAMAIGIARTTPNGNSGIIGFFGGFIWSGGDTAGAASVSPGEWRAEFLLGDSVVVSENFVLQDAMTSAIRVFLSGSVAPGFPSNFVTIGVSVLTVITCILTWSLFLRRRKK